jgi:dinuclear metal center YbgI/SA1388 family protein
MKLKDIHKKLNEISPFELQEKWDSSGLVVGDMDREVDTIILSLDIDRELLLNSDENVLFIVHHPLIFGGVDSLDFSKYPSNLLEIMVKKNQSCIAMHTNFDKTHLNRYVFEEILGFNAKEQNDFLCTDSGDWSYEEIVSRVRDRLDLDVVRVVSPKKSITSISLCTGAGASMIDNISSDCFLTGDIKYHDAMSAKSKNLMMIDIGHYESERFFAEVLARELKHLPLLAIISNSKNPFIIQKDISE